MAPHVGALAVSGAAVRESVVGHAGGRILVRASLGAMLAFLALACSTDPPTEPLIPVFGVTLAGAPADGVALDGASVQLTATALGPNDEPLEGRDIDWASAATGVATVNWQGRVETHDVGEVEISATSEGITSALTLSVREGTTVPPQGAARTANLLDGMLTLIVSPAVAPAGTVVHARAGVAWPPDARIIAGTVVEIGPEGTELAQALVVRVSFVPTEIPAEERDQLRLHGLDANGQWVELPQPSVDLTDFFVEADLMRLTTVAIFRPVTTP